VIITKVEAIHCALPYTYHRPEASGAQASRWPSMDTLLIRIGTDEGIEGWGEAFGFIHCATTRHAVEALIEPLCIGKDPRNIAALMDGIARKLHNFGRSGAVAYGLSGVDIALWDIAGKIANKPIYRLLADTTVTELPAYASLLRYGDPDVVAKAAALAVSRGFSNIKIHEIGTAEVAAARQAIGPGIPLTVDMNCPWSCDDALKMADAWKAYDVFWMEEPIWPPDDFSAMAKFAARSPIKLAAGENAGSLQEFERLMDIGKVAFVQPSVTKVGGITEMLRIIQAAKARGVTVALHSPYFGPGLTATVHLIAALLPQSFVEWYFCDLAARPYGGEIDANRNGKVIVPQGPGLGLGPDYAAIEKYRR
jgi:L-alanine-DL-glutamate epimerase-like enolase superfamily enzyme